MPAAIPDDRLTIGCQPPEEDGGAVSESSRVWITGAGSGIGRALALRLACDGATVAASARSSDALAALTAECSDRIHPFPLDVTDAGAVAACVAAVEERLGPLDQVVLNAGTHIPMGLEDFRAPCLKCETTRRSNRTRKNEHIRAFCLG